MSYKQRKLSRRRFLKLDAAGFVWDPFEASWYEVLLIPPPPPNLNPPPTPTPPQPRNSATPRAFPCYPIGQTPFARTHHRVSFRETTNQTPIFPMYILGLFFFE